MGWDVSFGEAVDQVGGVLDVDEIVEHRTILELSVAVEVAALELAFVDDFVEMDQLAVPMEKAKTVLSFVCPALVEFYSPVSAVFLALFLLYEYRISLAIVGMITFLRPFRPVFLAILLYGEIFAGMRVSQRKPLLKFRLLAFILIELSMLRR